MQHSEISRKHRRKRKSQNDIMSKIFHNHPNKKKMNLQKHSLEGFEHSKERPNAFYYSNALTVQ